MDPCSLYPMVELDKDDVYNISGKYSANKKENIEFMLNGPRWYMCLVNHISETDSPWERR